MSTDYRIHGRDIKLDELLSSTRLVEIVTNQTTKTERLISPDEDGGCWFYLDDDGVIQSFTRFGIGANWEAAETIQELIENEFKVQVPSEHDDDYWTKEEREEWEDE